MSHTAHRAQAPHLPRSLPPTCAAYYAATESALLCCDDIVTIDDEQELRRAWDDGDFRAVTTLALERYGPEILGVLAIQLRSTADASEAFSIFSEALWAGVPGF